MKVSSKLIEKVLSRIADLVFSSYEHNRNLHNEYLAKGSKKSVTQKALFDIVAAKHFQKETGIYAEGMQRTILISLHELTNYTCTWKDFRQAQQFIEFKKNHETIIKIGRVDEWLYHINKTVGIVLGGLAAISVLYMGNAEGLEQAIQHLILIFTLLYIAYFNFQLTWPVMSAKKIKRALK